MTIIEAINILDSVKPNAYNESDKIHWLSVLDSKIHKEIIKKFEDAEPEEFNGYTEDINLNTQLLAENTYADLYVLYMSAQIDFYNGESSRYNSSMMAFQQAYDDFASWYNREHKHLKGRYLYW